MNTDLITEHLDLWTSAVTYNNGKGRGNNGEPELTGIQKLRELILDLAVRGKLVPQDPEDEPASKLLERIEEEKKRLYKEGKIKKSKKLPEIIEEEKPFRLPESWRWTRLGYSTTYGDAEKAEPGSVSSDTWVLELEDIEKSTSRIVQRRFCSERNFKSSKNKFWKGDVLYGKLRPYLDKVLVAPENGVCTTEIIPFRGFSNLSSSYLRWTLKAPFFKDYATNSTHGMSLPRLGTEKAQKALIPLPPVNEQERIVEKVDELMALCDRLEQQTSDQLSAHETLVDTLLDTLTRSQDAAELSDNWARLAEHFDILFTTEHSIDRLEKTILQLAVMGRLVPQDPNEEPASLLLERIVAEKKRLIEKGTVRKAKKSDRHSGEDGFFTVKKGWEWRPLEDLFAVVTDGDHQAPPKTESGVPFLTIGNLNSGFVDFSGSRHVPEEYYDSIDWSRKPNARDILYTVTGSYGIPVKVLSEKPFCVQRHVAILKSVSDTPVDYINLFLKTAFSFDYATKISTGIAQKTVPLSGLRMMPIAVPPEQEMERILKIADELMALCHRLKSRLIEAGEIQNDLADSIIKQAVD